MIDSELVENFIRHIEDSTNNGVPELHFRFWNTANDEAKQQCVDHFRNDPEAMARSAARRWSTNSLGSAWIEVIFACALHGPLSQWHDSAPGCRVGAVALGDSVGSS